MILIADDDNAIRMSLGLMLRQAGYEWKAVSNEPDTLAAVRQHTPEIVILDMNLTLSSTGRQGIDLLRKIKILSPQSEVILISAWGTIPLAVEGVSLGAADFITKPWSNADVLAKIRRLLDARRIRESEQPPTLNEIERAAVTDALRKCDGRLSDAAQMLGITRQALYRRLEKYGMK